MSLSIGGLSPMNYAVSNTAAFSDAYVASVKNNEPASFLGNVGAVQPVVYPNAQAVDEGKAIEQAQKSKDANKAYNNLASGYAGASTGYNNNSLSYGYEMVGSTLDLFA